MIETKNNKQIKLIIGDTVFVDIKHYAYEEWKRPFIGKVVHINEDWAIVKAIIEPNMLIESEYGAFVGKVKIEGVTLI